MSETTNTVTGTTKPLISSSPANQASAAASSASAAALVTIIIWAIGLAHVQVPPEVSAAFVVLIGAGVHYLVVKYGLSSG